MSFPTLQQRTAEISKNVNILSEELALLGFPQPSFEDGIPEDIYRDAPDSIARSARVQLLQNLDELRALLTEPTLLLTFELRNPLISVHSIIRLGIAEAFPAQGITVHDLAQGLNLHESHVRRLLAHCATYYVYKQTRNDFYEHTAASKELAKSSGLRQWILIGAEELIPATLKTAEALIKYPNSEEPEHCGWSVTNATDLPAFRALASMPDRAAVSAGAMTWHGMLPGYSVRYLVEAFPWGSGNNELTIVDVGGGLGHVSRVLAEHDPTVRCMVQDSSHATIRGQRDLPAELQERISFQSHDFFQEQPVRGADFYLLRLVLHDWSDKYSLMIIRALIPALKPGAKVVINDRVVPGHGEAPYLVEREARDFDIYMLAFQNGRERTMDEWMTLFKQADTRFQISSVRQPPNSSLAVIEVEWKGTAMP